MFSAGSRRFAPHDAKETMIVQTFNHAGLINLGKDLGVPQKTDWWPSQQWLSAAACSVVA